MPIFQPVLPNVDRDWPILTDITPMAIDLLTQTLPFIKSHIYPASVPLSDWKLKEGEFPHAASPSLNDTKWWKYTIPAPWGGYDKTVWFRRRVRVPREFSGKPVALLLDLPESLLYLNGKPYHGVDSHHQEVLLTTRARTNQSFLVAIEAYSGRRSELSTFNSAELVTLNPTARLLYHGLLALHELERTAGQSTPESKEVREIIRQTLVFLKYFKPEGEEYPNAIVRAYNFLSRTLETEYKTDIQGLIHLIAQSHIDVVWLWRLQETKRKCARTFSTVLRLMEEFPELSYTQSQALLYELVKEKYPDLYKEIKQKVSEGRWHPIGSTWVEPDCNIPNGESLVRQILHGKRFFRREFGLDSDVLWLPDSFGYSWALPQILKKTGIKYFFTTKLTWNDTTKFRHNTFWWQGIDGSKVLSHAPAVGLEGSIAPKDLKKSWEGFVEKEESPETLQTFGFGDGGGGPTKEQIESWRILRTIVGLPPSTFSSVTGFFKVVEEHAGELETWDDELYLEKHRGTYTTLGWVKRENRQAESQLYATELLSVLGWIFGATAASRRYEQDQIEKAWKKLLLNQFHDIVTGTSIAEVLDDVRKDFAEIRRTCEQLQHRALSGLVKNVKRRTREYDFAIFNPLAWKRNEYVLLEVKSKGKNFLVLDDHGRAVDHQILGRKKGIVHLLCYLENVPPFSFANLVVSPSTTQPAAAAPWKISHRLVDTPLYRLRLDSKGHFTSLYDKTLRRELIAKGARANVFQSFKDTPKQWDAWEIDPEYPSKQFELLKFNRIRILEMGPLRAAIRIEHKSDSGSSVSQDIRFYHKSRRIDFLTSVRWKEKQTLLKVSFPLNVKTSNATYEIQFGALQRTTKPTELRHRAMYEVPAQQWADLSEQKAGVSLINDCKYGYDASENRLRLTLLRSPHYPHPLDPLRLTDNRVTDQGDHQLSYALYPHAGDWRTGETLQRAREFNQVPLVIRGSADRISPLISYASSSIIVDCIKKAEDSDDVIVRIHEAHGQPAKVTFEFGARLEAVAECDMLENDLAPLKPVKSKLTLKFSPFEIKTLKLAFKPKR